MATKELAAVEVSPKTQGRALPQDSRAEGGRPYRKPEVYALGALEQLQGTLRGRYYEGPSPNCYRY